MAIQTYGFYFYFAFQRKTSTDTFVILLTVTSNLTSLRRGLVLGLQVLLSIFALQLIRNHYAQLPPRWKVGVLGH